MHSSFKAVQNMGVLQNTVSSRAKVSIVLASATCIQSSNAYTSGLPIQNKRVNLTVSPRYAHPKKYTKLIQGVVHSTVRWSVRAGSSGCTKEVAVNRMVPRNRHLVLPSRVSQAPSRHSISTRSRISCAATTIYKEEKKGVDSFTRI